MKTTITILALALAAPLVWGQATTTEKTTTTHADGSTTTTTTTTTSAGTITEFEPGKTVILKEESGPRTYRFGPHVVYETRAGVAIPEAEVRTRIHVGAPIHVHYAREGDGYIVNRVIVDD